MPTDKHECYYKEEIEEILEFKKEVARNSNEIDKIKSGDWYNNKELYEMIENLKQQFTEFNDNFHKYNGLLDKHTQLQEKLKTQRDELDTIKKKQEKKEARKEGEKDTNSLWKDNIAWIIGVLGFLAGVASQIL
jgi:chromosome segregation ATPase